MGSIDARSLSSWGSTARDTFATSWALVPIISILNYAGVIDSRSGLGLVVSVIVAIVWTVSGLTWAVAEYRRRQ